MASSKYAVFEDTSSLKNVGEIKEKSVIKWCIPEIINKSARTNVFLMGRAWNCLVLSVVSEEPECLNKFDVWIHRYTCAGKDRAKVTFALLDDKDCLQCMQEKDICNSSIGSNKVGVTFDLGAFKTPQKFFCDGFLKIHCVLEFSDGSSDSEINSSSEDAKISLLNMLANINEEGPLKLKTVIKWNIPHLFVSQGEMYGSFTFCSSLFVVTIYALKNLEDYFLVHLCKSSNITEAFLVRIAVSDARDQLYDEHEEYMLYILKPICAYFNKSILQKRQWPFHPDMLSIQCEIQHFLKNTLVKQDLGTSNEPKETLKVKESSCTPSCCNSKRKLVDLESFLETGEFSDIILCTDGKEFKVHRIMLATCAPNLLKELNLNIAENTDNRVNVQNINSDTLRHILYYIYTGETDTSSLESFLCLLPAAYKLDLRELIEKCREFLASILTPHNALEILIVANQCSESDLKKSALQVICNNIREVLNTSGWETFHFRHPGLVKEMFTALSEKLQL